ncbi:MAG: hypothetical protein GF353_21270 [Candidatus Lokiarchaeota archaeon]|nr:hypothetical protein [Candidatus Lokiarchaeota archaeon]
MQLTLFNGSPRGRKSNTKILLNHFCDGFTANNENEFIIHYLNQAQKIDQHVEQFRNADHVIIAFPLYTDAMPGIVKHFIEGLAPLCGRAKNPSLGFIVQSGFPEPIHSRYVERYCEKLAQRLGCRYTGTAIRGGVEGIQIQPPWMTKKLFRLFHELGVQYTAQKRMDPAILKKLAPREKMSAFRRFGFKIMLRTGIGNLYWNMQLKENGVFERRFEGAYLGE